MCVVDGSAERTKQFEALREGEIPLSAIIEQTLSFDILHDDVRTPIIGRASIEQCRDVRMLKSGEDLPLRSKARQRLRCGHPLSDELDSDRAQKLIIGANRLVDGAHAAPSNFAHELVRADVLPYVGGRTQIEVGLNASGSTLDHCAQTPLSFGVAFEKRLDLPAEFHVSGTNTVQESGSLGCGKLCGLEEYLLDPPPTLGFH
jgi:hypothetical protein